MECKVAQIILGIEATRRASVATESIGAGGVNRFGMVGDDPASARHENLYTITMARGAWSIRTDAHTVMTATRDDFMVSAALDAFEGDCRLFTKTWERRIPRDGV